MNLKVGRDTRVDHVKELAELDGAVTRIAFADHLAGQDVERGEERRRAVALVVVGSSFDLPGA